MWTAQTLLTRLAESQDGVRLDNLDAEMDSQRNSIVMGIQVLKRRGLVEIIGKGHYRITEDGRKHLIVDAAIRSGSNKPKQRKVTKGLRRRAWWLIRKNRKVSIPSLLSTLASGNEKAAAKNLGKYLGKLTEAGYLAPMKSLPGASKHSNGHKRWLLINDPGPLPPVWRQKENSVFDPNSGETTPLYKEVSHG